MTTAAAAASVVVGGAVMLTTQDVVAPSVDSSSAALRLGAGPGGSAGLVGGAASVAPAADGLEQVDAQALVKAAGLADQQAKAEQKAAELACPPNAAGFGAVKPWVATAGFYLRCKFNVQTVLGVGGRAGISDHPLGLALDFMVDRGTGDSLANCVLQNKAALGVTYVIWRQRINFGNGWQMMEDRGGITANHYDHVHVSFLPHAGGGSPQCGGTST